MKTPLRGEVWLVDLGLAANTRPAVVVSVPAADEDRALATLVPHTTATRASRFEADVPVPFLKPGAFDAQGIVTIPLVRLIRPLGRLSPAQMASVDRAVLRWLGFESPGT